MEQREIQLMAELEETHWWFVGKRLAMASLLESVPLPKDAKALDLGCGTGANLRMLAGRCPALGVDLNPACLGCAACAPGPPLMRAASQALPLASRSLDMVLCADLLYHREVDLYATLREIRRVLKPGGWLLILDSAYQGLMGPHDLAMHGARRFTTGGLAARLAGLGFYVERTTYRNSILAPVFVATRLVEKLAHGLRGPGKEPPRSDVSPPSPMVNALLTRLMRLEARWLKKHDFAMGSTVCVLARKM